MSIEVGSPAWGVCANIHSYQIALMHYTSSEKTNSRLKNYI